MKLYYIINSLGKYSDGGETPSFKINLTKTWNSLESVLQHISNLSKGGVGIYYKNHAEIKSFDVPVDSTDEFNYHDFFVFSITNVSNAMVSAYFLSGTITSEAFRAIVQLDQAKLDHYRSKLNIKKPYFDYIKEIQKALPPICTGIESKSWEARGGLIGAPDDVKAILTLEISSQNFYPSSGIFKNHETTNKGAP